MTSLARRERAALTDLLDCVGPDAPTLCEGWSTRDLVAHLLVRESSPAGVGNVVPALAGWADRSQRSLARQDYTRLVQHVRSGPPLWSPLRIHQLDVATNTTEYFVHHEDVRRAAPGWQPRQLDPADQATLWKAARRQASFLLRGAGLGVELRTPDGRQAQVKEGSPSVALVGEPAELLLYLYGRGEQARVELRGDPGAVAVFRRTDLST